MAYNYNTGKELLPGEQQATFNTQTGQKIGTDTYSADSISKGVAPTGVISSATLQSSAPIVIPPTTSTPTTNNLSIGTNAVTSSIKTDATYEPPVNPQKDQLQQMLQSLGGDIQDQASQEEQIRKDLQVYEKKQKATAVSNQLDQMDKSYRDEVAEIKKNAGGMETSGVQARVADATDRYENNRANVALTYKVLAGDYNDALQIVNDKVASLDKHFQNKIQLYTLAKDAVFNNLTESEKLTVQANIQKKQADAKLVSDAYSAVLTNLSTNGAPASVYSAVDEASRLPGATAASVLAAAGTWGVDKGAQLDLKLKQAQIDSANRANRPGSEAPTVKTINGVDMQWNPTSGKWETIGGDTTNALGNAIAENKVDNINNILNSGGLDSAVGPNSLARTNTGLWGAAKRFFSGAVAGGVAGAGAGAVFGGVGAIPGALIGALTTGVVNTLRGTKDELTGDRQNFIASTEQVRSELTVAKLAQAKGQGVTFGALSDGERGLIANAATKIGTWAIYEDGDREKSVLGYNIDEKSFKKEMDVINYFTKLDAILRGAAPESLGVVTQPDGTLWVLNSDGTYSQLKRY